MRKGVNPEKNKNEINQKKYHRIIIPVYIPDIGSEYYAGSIDVLERCLNSLSKTINPKTTVITVVNNNCGGAATTLIEKFLKAKKLDKHVIHVENRGKVFVAISEARGSFEEFITICDADVLFFSGWEKAVFEIFENYPQAGVVSPVPSQNLALYHNSSVFYDKFLNSIQYGKIVPDEDCELFLQGLGNEALLRRNNHPYDWKEKQYYLNGKSPVLLGANHYVATYRKEVLEHQSDFPKNKFKKGYEENFLDEPADILGYYRLSTVNSFAYHMGNRMDDVSGDFSLKQNALIENDYFHSIPKAKSSKIPYSIRKNFFRILRKLKKI
ncbi:glycosyltransferase family A protein [Autumnicola edwardsiae]|uniref:Glycosyltransferase family A protein n=1 Tax=Autumnicola edwardsiae TaxID=3075594 RepID=A0ABU3CR85_9FLAO|nr:glycosyltransferase family A protein [Zunongwangia sp. F297]MDT0648858.1 glycosyltransferase family A protein [Zunongwangia sp. F297]